MLETDGLYFILTQDVKSVKPLFYVGKRKIIQELNIKERCF